MQRLLPALMLLAACSAATEPSSTASTVLAGSYTATSINGIAMPVAVAPLPDGSKQEIIADRLWISGPAGVSGVMWRVVVRTTKGTDSRIDSTTFTGTFTANLATAQTTFGPVSASGRTLTFRVNDGSVRVYQRND